MLEIRVVCATPTHREQELELGIAQLERRKLRDPLMSSDSVQIESVVGGDAEEASNDVGARTRVNHVRREIFFPPDTAAREIANTGEGTCASTQAPKNWGENV